MKFISDKSIDKLSSEEFLWFCSPLPIDKKKQILQYLKSITTPNAFTSQPVIDKLTNKETKKIDNAFTDGEYVWYASEVYHFEKYDLKLNDDFIEYVLNRS